MMQKYWAPNDMELVTRKEETTNGLAKERAVKVVKYNEVRAMELHYKECLETLRFIDIQAGALGEGFYWPRKRRQIRNRIACIMAKLEERA